MKKTLLFTTDIHLNFCKEDVIRSFAKSLLSHNPDVIVVGGDISEAPELEIHLRFLEMYLNGVPLYFVCGNHDYYRGSIEELRKSVLSPKFSKGGSVWLPTAGIVSLSPTAALIGHDGWYDGGYPGYGNWFDSKLGMSDYVLIQELKHGRTSCFDEMNYYSEQGAEHIRKYLPLAFENHDEVFFVTHVSPFPETSRGPNGKISDPNWMPSFCSRRVGEELVKVMKKQESNKKLIVLCGHSHTEASHVVLPNLEAFCGKARYKYPAMAKLFKFS